MNSFSVYYKPPSSLVANTNNHLQNRRMTNRVTRRRDRSRVFIKRIWSIKRKIDRQVMFTVSILGYAQVGNHVA